MPAVLPEVKLGSVDSPPPGFILPQNIFAQPALAAIAASTAPGNTALAAKPLLLPAASITVPVSKARLPDITIYASPASRSYFAAAGIDYQRNIGTWEGLLRRYELPFQVANMAEAIEQGSGVLILPSAVALSEREKKAIAQFRERGGSVLATWLAGVRNDAGAWNGFGFMEKTLESKVVGNTEAEADDAYLIPHGDNPVTHGLPAGQRVWTERLKEWYPLRLKGVHEAAQVMDWSRTVKPGQTSAVIVYNERREISGQQSRVVVLGYPEKLWISSEPKSMDTMAVDAVRWLMRQPQTYAAAWPHPYTSSMVLAVDASDGMEETDAALAKKVAALGGKASYFVLTEQAAQSRPTLQAIQAGGHEIAYLGDRFTGFKDEPAARQTERLKVMGEEMKSAGITVAANAGFRPPMESFDATTVKLLQERGTGYMVTDSGATEARLPFVAAPGSAAGSAPLLGLPRTLNSPDDVLSEGDAATAMKTFLQEFDMSLNMAGLGILTTPARGSLSEADWTRIFAHIKSRQKNLWLASGAQVADWWRERERVSVTLDASVVPALMTVRIKGEGQLRQPVTVLANLPQMGNTVRLVADTSDTRILKTASVDPWRSAILVDGLGPGVYRWYVYFDAAPGAR